MGRFGYDGWGQRRGIRGPGAHPCRHSPMHDQGQPPAGAGIVRYRLVAHRFVPLRPQGRRRDWWAGWQFLPFG